MEDDKFYKTHKLSSIFILQFLQGFLFILYKLFRLYF
jgi:hypothetical protein